MCTRIEIAVHTHTHMQQFKTDYLCACMYSAACSGGEFLVWLVLRRHTIEVE